MTKINKIFGISDNKTGTTTLGAALNILGFSPCAEFGASKRLIGHVENDVYDLLEPSIAFANNFRNFNDFPWNLLDFYKHFDRKFKNSKFILTVRDPKVWFKSFLRFATTTVYGDTDILWRVRKNFPKNEKKVEAFRKVLTYKHNIEDCTTVVADRDKYIQSYMDRNKKVINYFRNRPDDLLVVDWSKSNNNWAVLCNFLGVPIPRKRRFPHRMKQRYNI